jgi:hypothetical protein
MYQPRDIRLGRRDFLRMAMLAPALGPAFQNARGTGGAVRFLTYDEAEPILRSGRLSAPSALTNQRNDVRRVWPQWARQRDTEIRHRLQRGDEDTLANFVLFGTSFTSLPRVTPDIADPGEMDRRIRTRVQAFVDAVAVPGNSERLALLSALISRLGYSAVQGEPRERLARYVVQNINRYLAEGTRYQTMDRRGRNDSPTPAAISDLYKDRGLSGDTDF